jgi:hypothetical protein
VTKKKEGNVYLPKRRSKKINVSKKKEGRRCSEINGKEEEDVYQHKRRTIRMFLNER